MAKWKKQNLKLKDKHHWKARDGYRILVLDRGAVRFDVPEGWVLKPDDKSIKLFDGEPPNDDCRLEISFNRLPPVDWSGFPVAQALREAFSKDVRGLTATGDYANIIRHELRLAWAEFRFTDPIENREAFTRALLGIGGNVQCLITMDFWAEDADRVRPVWDEVVRTLQLGVRIEDPTTGAMLQPRFN